LALLDLTIYLVAIVGSLTQEVLMVLYGIAYCGSCPVAVKVYALSEVIVIVVCELLLNAATYLACSQFRNHIIAPFMVKQLLVL
jgi:hypothetical protein